MQLGKGDHGMLLCAGWNHINLVVLLSANWMHLDKLLIPSTSTRLVGSLDFSWATVSCWCLYLVLCASLLRCFNSLDVTHVLIYGWLEVLSHAVKLPVQCLLLWLGSQGLNLLVTVVGQGDLSHHFQVGCVQSDLGWVAVLCHLLGAEGAHLPCWSFVLGISTLLSCG